MNANFQKRKGRRRRWRVSKRERERHGHDCVSLMQRARTRPDVLAEALREMGVTEEGKEE